MAPAPSVAPAPPLPGLHSSQSTTLQGTTKASKDMGQKIPVTVQYPISGDCSPVQVAEVGAV